MKRRPRARRVLAVLAGVALIAAVGEAAFYNARHAPRPLIDEHIQGVADR